MVDSKEIYVSRYHGNDSPSCGKTIHMACKTIALATTQAHWNDTIYIDGNGTLRDPYPCSSMTSYPGGIYVNRNLTLERFGKDEVFLKCSSQKQMIFDGRCVSGKVIIRLKGLTFINSYVTVQKCSLYIESCVFKDAVSFPNTAAIINFESFEERCFLAIIQSKFSNNDVPCIRVVGSKLKIEVHDTVFINNTANRKNVTVVDEAVFMVLLPVKDSAYLSCFITLTNTSFISNTAPSGGSLNILGSSVISTNRRKKKRYSDRRDKSVLLQPFFNKNQYVSQSSKEHIFMNVTDATFLHNIGGAITLSDVHIAKVFIARCVFANNIATSTIVGVALLFDDSAELFVRLIDSNFTNNSARNRASVVSLIGGSSMILRVRSVLFLGNVLHDPSWGVLSLFPNTFGYLNILLEKVHFISNKAGHGSSTLFEQGYRDDITIVDSSFVGNSQIESYYNDWQILRIFSDMLNFTMIGTVISGNYAKRLTDSIAMKVPRKQFIVQSDVAQINITGLQFKNNKGGGIYFLVGDFVTVPGPGSTVFFKDSRFENNEYFSFNVISRKTTTLQMRRLVFRGNTFLNSTLQCFGLFFLSLVGEGNQITLEDTTFDNNTYIQGRIVFFQLPLDKTKSSTCKPPKWNYKNVVRFTKVRFCKNYHPHSTALELHNGRIILSDCLFLNNFGRGIGTNLLIAEGSASLELINTSFELTQSWPVNSYYKTQLPPFRGFIYVGSAGPIKLENTNLSVEEFQDIDSYLMVTSSRDAAIDNNSVIRCPVGTLSKFMDYSHSYIVTGENCPREGIVTKSQSFTFSCTRCSAGFYSIDPYETKCRPCPYGGNCTSNIAARPTFWGFPSLSDRGSVNFQHCPVDYCCPYRNISCPYSNDTYLSNGCSGNRMGVLCGHCKPNFTETLFSAQCRASEGCTDYWFWPVALFYTLAFALFLLWKNCITCHVMKLLPWRRSTQGGQSSGDLASDGGGYIKVIFYFYQVASLVFVFTDIEIHLVEKYLLIPVIGWFDFKPISSDKGLVCPIRGLTVASKMFLQASHVIAVLFGIGIIYLLHGALRKYRKRSPFFPSADRYLAATVDCLLLGYSTLASTTLKALNCVPIQTSSRFFYDGNIQCWQWWQKLCGVVICVFIVPFVFVLYRGSKLLHRKELSAKRFLYACLIPLPFAVRWLLSCKKIPHSETGHSSDNSEQLSLLPADRSIRRQCITDPVQSVIYGPFKKPDDREGSGAVYWESVLIGRRLVLISLHTFIVFPFIRMVCLTVAYALILTHHIWKKPFKDVRVNHGETASLTALLVLAVVNMAEFAFAFNGGILSKQQRACLMVLHVVEVIILGTVPLLCVLIFFIAVLWQLIKLCKLCWVSLCRLIVKTWLALAR